MATKNEKVLASFVSCLINELKDNGIELKSATPELLSSIAQIIQEPTDVATIKPRSNGESKKDRECYYYTGCEFVTMPEKERYEHGICEFTVTRDGRVVLRLFYHPNLREMLQPVDPSDLSKGFGVCYTHKVRLAGKDGIRPFLKGLADLKLSKPATFNDRYTNKYIAFMPESMRVYKDSKFVMPEKQEDQPATDPQVTDESLPNEVAIEQDEVSEDCGF